MPSCTSHANADLRRARLRDFSSAFRKMFCNGKRMQELKCVSEMLPSVTRVSRSAPKCHARVSNRASDFVAEPCGGAGRRPRHVGRDHGLLLRVELGRVHREGAARRLALEVHAEDRRPGPATHLSLCKLRLLRQHPSDTRRSMRLRIVSRRVPDVASRPRPLPSAQGASFETRPPGERASARKRGRSRASTAAAMA